MLAMIAKKFAVVRGALKFGIIAHIDITACSQAPILWLRRMLKETVPLMLTLPP
jgi:hypothetical protein